MTEQSTADRLAPAAGLRAGKRLPSRALVVVAILLALAASLFSSASMTWPRSQSLSVPVAVKTAVNTNNSIPNTHQQYHISAGHSHGPPTSVNALFCGEQTYYVLAGDTPVLVHNSNCTPLGQDTLDKAFDLANTPDKLSHVIDPAKHGFGDIVQAAGGREQAMRSIVDSLRCSCGLPTSGPFEVQRLIFGETVTIRGAMVDGIPRIGTAFVPAKFPGAP